MCSLIFQLRSTYAPWEKGQRQALYEDTLLHAAGWTGLHPPMKIRRQFITFWLHIAHCCWVTPPSKGQTVKYWIILPHTGTKPVDEQIYCLLWGSLVLLQEKKKHFAKQHQVHKQATYLNEPDNYLNIFPLLLQWAAINERGRLKLVYVPKALISLRLTYEYGGGWSVWVEAIDSMYLRRCQARRIQTHSDGSCKKCRRGAMLPVHICIPPGAAVTCDKSNHLPSSQTVLVLNLKLLMRKGTWKKNCDSSIPRARCPLSLLPLPCQLISRLSRYCYKVWIQTHSIMPAHTHNTVN